MTSNARRERSGSSASRRRSRAVWSTACSAAVAALLAGCGGGGAPALERTDAAPLIALAGRIAAEHGCAQAHDIARLSARTHDLLGRGAVPLSLRERLQGGVRSLVAQAPLCLPSVAPSPTAAQAPAATPPPPPPGGDRHGDHGPGDHGHGDHGPPGHGHGHPHGHAHGHGG